MKLEHPVVGKSYFSQLRAPEQQLIALKFLPSAEHVAKGASMIAWLHELIHVPGDLTQSANKFLTLRNFIRQASAIPQAWEQIETIVGVAVSYLEIRVFDRDEFLRALQAHGYSVNSWMEKVSRWVGHGHRFDSARALTEYRHDPQLHFVNDRADEEAYGPNYFFVHWDAQSVYARRGSLIGRIMAGRTHAHQCATPQQVEEYLNGLETCQNS
jgi:hypothetical protein